MRLIDADKIEPVGSCIKCALDAPECELVKAFRNTPTLDAEPIKRGRWIDRGKDMCIRWKCSECGRKDTHIYNYCPDCGALMMDESTMSQVKVDVSIKKPTKRWDTCGLTEGSVLVDTGARGEKVEKVTE